MNKNNRGFLWIAGIAILLIFLCCIVIAFAAFAAPKVLDRFEQSPAATAPLILPTVAPQSEPITLPTLEPTPTPPLLSTYDDVETRIYAEVYERVNPSVVAIMVLDEEMLEDSPHNDIRPFFFYTGEGSGFVVDERGYIVTNRHVVMDADDVVVRFYDGLLAPAEIVGEDRDTDLAVLKVDPQGLDLRPVAFGDIDELRVGERVIVIGNPFGNTNTMTTGIVSALGRHIELFDTQFQLPEVIQTDAAINPGNSGGPMLNARGEVIGVAFMLQSETRTNAGIGFGIPVYFVKRVSEAIIEQGRFRHPYLGIRGSGLSPFVIQELGLPVAYGILIADVLPDTPAAKAGLRGGEDTRLVEGMPFALGGDIIIGVDGRPLKVFDDLLSYLGRYTEPGDDITLTIVRDGEQLEVTVTLEPRPE
ncbi:MAG TPA: PDZ domain-containing protein [Caldilineae bacterium]|nr:PDZ domain-containing protein [Caldilineae bacterium]